VDRLYGIIRLSGTVDEEIERMRGEAMKRKPSRGPSR
jgi:hypothetical protein